MFDKEKAPQEYCYYTTYDGENYLVHITIPISREQFDALGDGDDLWKAIMR